MKTTTHAGSGPALESQAVRSLDHIRTERALSPNTVLPYSSDLACFLSWAACRKLRSAEEINRVALIEYRRALSLGEEKGSDVAKSAIRSPRSVRRAQATLRAFFRFLRTEGLLS